MDGTAKPPLLLSLAKEFPMPDPDTDISSASSDFRHELEGPAEDDIEASFDPDEIEASRARELGLGVGERELNLQRDVHGSGAATRDGDVERMSRDEIRAADSIADSDASNLDIDDDLEGDQDQDA
jgi:hypothetical protein